MSENKNGNNQQPLHSNEKDSGLQEGPGRFQGSQNPAYENEKTESDISNVDQQEGNMKHGTVGGNLSSDNSSETTKQ